jgi:hypothetical protein
VCPAIALQPLVVVGCGVLWSPRRARRELVWVAWWVALPPVDVVGLAAPVPPRDAR